MTYLLIFEFVMKSGHVHNIATSSDEDTTEAAAQIIDNFSKLETLSGYDPRTKRYWRVVTDDISIVEAFAGQMEEG